MSTPYPFKTKPFSHQLQCWEVSKDRKAFAFLMEMGTGKTKVLIDTAAYLYDNGRIDSLVVFAPKGVYRNWQDSEIPVHMPAHIRYRVAAWTSNPTREDKEATRIFEHPSSMNYLRILLVNVEAMSTKRAYEYVEKFCCGSRPMIAIDESTVIKHAESKRTKALLYLGKFGKYLRIMSGEPAANSPLDLWSQFEFLEPGILGFSSFFSFRNNFAKVVTPFDVKRVQRIPNWGRTPVADLASMTGLDEDVVAAIRRGAGQGYTAVLGYKNMDELQQLLSKHSFIVKKADCLDLPEKIYQTRDVEMNKEQREAYDRMKEECVVYVEELLGRQNNPPALRQRNDLSFDELHACQGSLDLGPRMCECPKGDDPLLSPICPMCGGETGMKERMSSAMIVITQLLLLHQIACGFLKTDDGEEIDLGESNPRMEELVELLQNHPGKAIIWATYRRSIQQIEKRLAKEFGAESVVTYYGGTKPEDRRRAIKEFQNPDSKVKYFVANRSGAYGLTLTAADLVIYFSNDYDREVRGQSEDRCHRIGQTKHVTYIDLRCRGTVDEKIIKALKDKKKLSEAITPSNWRSWFV